MRGALLYFCIKETGEEVAGVLGDPVSRAVGGNFGEEMVDAVLCGAFWRHADGSYVRKEAMESL